MVVCNVGKFVVVVIDLEYGLVVVVFYGIVVVLLSQNYIQVIVIVYVVKFQIIDIGFYFRQVGCCHFLKIFVFLIQVKLVLGLVGVIYYNIYYVVVVQVLYFDNLGQIWVVVKYGLCNFIKGFVVVVVFENLIEFRSAGI